MDWEHVALRWVTEYPGDDLDFVANIRCLVSVGWEEESRAGWRMPDVVGGACIMRRLKRDLAPQEIRDMIIGAARAVEAFGKALKDSGYPG